VIVPRHPPAYNAVADFAPTCGCGPERLQGPPHFAHYEQAIRRSSARCSTARIDPWPRQRHQDSKKSSDATDAMHENARPEGKMVRPGRRAEAPGLKDLPL